MMKTNKKLILATLLTIGGVVSMQAQTVRGTVTDAISGEKLIGATVRVVETGTGAVVDLEGNFSVFFQCKTIIKNRLTSV